MSIETKKATCAKVVTAIAFLAAIYQLLQTKFVFLPTDQHKNIHLTFCMVLVFLLQYKFEKKWYSFQNILTSLGIIASLVIGVYVHTQYFALMDHLGKLSDMDVIFGSLIIAFAIIATWRDWGWTIPAIVLAAIAYALWGQYLPGSWFHAGVSFRRLVGACSLFMSGIYGSLLRISALEVVMFILFGSVLDAAGGGDLFIMIAKSCSRKLRSGVAQVAVIGSALFGTISGNIAANVATTGAITIPSMKKAGLKPELAGAIEAVASTGGQLMPPVMGVAAFMIVGITGIPYGTVMKAALFPALAYYLYLGSAIQIRACRQNWQISETDKAQALGTEGGMLKNYWHIFASFAVLGICLYLQVAPVLMANYITVALLVTTTVKMVLENKTETGNLIKKLTAFYVQGLSAGIKTCSKLTVSICTLGILVEVFTLTGFAQTFAFNMVQMAGNSLFLLCIFIFITCTFFGMGMTATSAYLLVAMLGAPAMVNFGVELLAAHLYCFYYGIMSSVTPPVARGVLVANGMAGGSFWKTAGYAVRLALPGFLLPFYFIYEPEILWYQNSLLASVWIFTVVMCGLIALTVLFEQYLFLKLSVLDNILFLVVVICSFWPEPITNIIAVAVFAGGICYQRHRRKRHSDPAGGIQAL